MNKLILFAVLYAISSVFGTAIIKKKLLRGDVEGFYDFLIFLFDPKIFAALFFIFISMFFTIKALSLAPFSSVIPFLTGIHFVFTVSVGVLYFQDKLALLGYVGITLVSCGVFLISKGYVNS